MLLSVVAQAYDWNNAAVNGGGFIDGMVYSEAAPNIFYAHTEVGGAFRWDYSANKWISVTNWTQNSDSNALGGAPTMATDPTDASRVYMVIWQCHGVQKLGAIVQKLFTIVYHARYIGIWVRTGSSPHAQSHTGV